MNDPYMPVERKYQLCRRALEIIAKHQFPVHIITKSDLVLRDIDLLKEINQVYAAVSFTVTVDDGTTTTNETFDVTVPVMATSTPIRRARTTP